MKKTKKVKGWVLLLLMCAGMLGGCKILVDWTMTNEDIIAECKKCEDAGMDIKILENSYGQAIGVECRPKAKP